MVSVPGRVLSPPKLQYGGKVSTQLYYIVSVVRTTPKNSYIMYIGNISVRLIINMNVLYNVF